mgnify:CR=1 FL=1|jgi:hypothetical protein
MCVNEVKRIGTESVLNFLIENKDIVNNYFVYVNDSNGTISYSDLTKHLSGTTKDGVNLHSAFLNRGILTRYLRCTYDNMYNIS